MLVLLDDGILGYDIKTYKNSENSKDSNGGDKYGQVYGFLVFTRNQDGTNANKLALSDDVYRLRILLKE